MSPMTPSKLAAAKAEKARLRELKKQQQEELERVRREQNAKVAKEGNKNSKYKVLLAETEVFAHFLAGSKSHAAKEKKGEAPLALMVLRLPVAFVKKLAGNM